jgi:hypothetical protein
MELKTSISLRAWATIQTPKLTIGSKGSEDVQLMQPHCVTFNSNGKVLITDTVTLKIAFITLTGQQTRCSLR